MIDTEKEIKLNPKFYGNISPNNQKRWSDYINNHPVKTLTFHKKEIEYISCGSGEQTVLTFHGAMGKAILNGQAIPFFEKKYRVIAPSITNFESLDEFSEAVNMILKKEKVEKYILIGGSFGSMMAQPYFHRNFNDIEGLILVNSYPPKNEWVKDFDRMLKLVKIIPSFLLMKLMSKKILKLADESKEMTPEIREEFEYTMAWVKERFATVKKSVLVSQTILTRDFNSEKYNAEDYIGWNGKVIIFTSNDDKGFPYHEDLKKQYSNPEEVIFKDAGHMGTLLKSDEYFENLNRFLSSIKR